MNLIRLAEILSSRESTLKWCRDNKLLLDSMKCDMCGSDAILRDPITLGHHKKRAGIFYCQNIIGNNMHFNKITKKVKKFEVTATRYSIFYNTRISIEKAIVLIYCWAHEFSIEQTKEICHSIRQNERTRCTYKTIYDWFFYLKEIAITILRKRYQNHSQIGGPGQIVKLHKTKFGKHKYNQEGDWILTMIEVNADGSEGNFRFEICPKNKQDTETLLTLIKIHIKTGSSIVSNEWKLYEHLNDLQYENKTNETMKSFPTNGHKRLLGNSLDIKEEKYLAEDWCGFLWRKKIKKKGTDMFLTIIEDITDCEWTGSA